MHLKNIYFSCLFIIKTIDEKIVQIFIQTKIFVLLFVHFIKE